MQGVGHAPPGKCHLGACSEIASEAMFVPKVTVSATSETIEPLKWPSHGTTFSNS